MEKPYVSSTRSLPVHKLVQLFCLFIFSLPFHLEAQTGEALDFDGITNSVTLPVALSGSYTKEAWIKPAAVANFPNIISGNNTALFIENGKLTAGHAGTFAYKEVQDPENLLTGTWYHVAVTYDASLSEMKLYKNGVLVSTNSGASAYTENFLFLSLFINANRFTGQMDEVRIWKTARTEAEINAKKDCELTGDEPGLIAYYNFNQGIAGGNNTAITTLTDSQDKCNPLNGTLTNFTLTGSSSNFVAPGATLSGTCNSQFANINITGNGLCILQGDVTPDAADHTSFGNFTTIPIVRTFTIQNTGNAPLNISSVLISGVNASDFSVSTPPASVIAGGSSSTFSISFNAGGAVGTKNAVIEVNSDDADELMYSFAVDGIKSQPARSLDFDGVNDDVSLPFVITGDYTKEAWIKTNTLSGFPNILSGTATALFLNNGKVAAGHVNGGFGQVVGATTITTNQWHHVAVSYNATTQDMKLYLNGALVATAAGVPGYTETILKIGSLNSTNFFWGRIDQIRIWKTVRSDLDIQNSYQCNISGDEPGLLAWYNFNQGAGEGNNTGITTATNDVDNCTAATLNGTLNNFTLSGTVSNWVSESNNILTNCAATFPNIKIEGNNNCITDGDNTPASTDFTDFGSVTGTGADRTFVIHNTGTAALNIGSISFTGTDNAMFTVGTAPVATIAPGASSNLVVHFLPVGTGLKTANIIINNDDADEAAYTFSLQGTGIVAALNIINVVATPNTDGTATVTWTTDAPANSAVDYGTAPGTLNLNSNNAALVTSHSIQLTGLNLGTSYHFRVTSVDAGSNSVTYPDPPAAPLSFSMPPAITLQPATQTKCEGTSVTFTTTASSDVASTVQWQISTDNGNNWQDSTGATTASISFTVSDEDDGKQFRAVWTNAGGSVNSDAALLTVSDTTWGVETISICNNLLPYTWNGNQYTTSGTYNITLAGANANGCDSVAVLNLTVKDTSFSVTNVSVCRNLLPYNWNGVDYTESGSYTIVLPAANVNGCDSTATLNLTVKDTSFSVTNVSVCRNLLPYNWNGIDYTESGNYTIVLPAANINGCDSTATLNLTVKDTSFSITNVSVCRNLLPYNWNGIDYTESGNYTIVLPAANINGCDSTATLNLTVKDTSFSVTNIAVCRNLLPYNWNGVDYTESGSYTIVLPAANVNDCDSTATLNLTLKDTSFSVTNISVCRNLLPYNWNGVDYTESGSYSIVLPAANINGCDSTATLSLTVKDTSFSITNVTICRNLLPYNWNGDDYTEGGNYTIVLPAANVNDCDSTATLNLTVKDTSFSVTNVSVCRNLLPYNWNDVDYTEGGSYTIVLPGANVNGCDSTATLNLTVKDTSFSVTNVSVCRNLLPYNWNGVDYTESGSYSIVLPAANVNGCDSTATLNLTVKDTSFSVTNVSVCRNLLPYNWNGIDYTESGSYTIVLPAANVNGCDSTATLNLTVRDTSFSVTNVSVCRNLLPYNWNGIDYTESGSYTIVLPAANVNGCDSTATLNLTVRDTSFSVTNVSVCRNLLPYNWNGVDYTESGNYTIVLPAANVNDCDSTATLNLTVKDTSFSVTNVSVCRNLLPYNWNGVDYTESGSYSIVLPAANVNGCDSTATLNLTVKDTSFSVTNVSVCRNLLPYNWNGVDYTESGSYTIVLPEANVNGCGSTATLNLTVKDTSFSVTNVSVCRNLLPYNWNGVDYTEVGNYTIVLPAANVNGCDSTATLNLTVKDTSFSITNVSICNNLLPYNWNGVDYTESGSYTIVLPAANVNGCDSTATLNLTVKDTSFSVTNVSVCRNLLPYNWNGVDYTEGGSYTIVLPAANVNDCDSTATLNLTVKDTSFSITNVTICSSALPYTWNGIDYTEGGTYTIVLSGINENDCDSTATLQLTVNNFDLGTGGKTPVSCIGAADGSFTISAYNGTGPFEYSIDGGATYQPSGLFQNLEGTYTIRARSLATGCVKDTVIDVGVEKLVWTGAADNNWHNAGNWNLLVVPASQSHVIIPAGTPVCIISNFNATAASVQVLTGAELRTENDKELTITGKCPVLPTQ